MSTFNGLVAEFPDLRIDFFRANPGAPPALACFLSHVHSDHLAGLESLRSPFVYCSPATREILLRLERYPCRINYAKGILETRQQTFKHLQKVLKPLPLDTPTCLELRPGHQIRVTLLDANHCPGAVMFLIEDEAHAILYTGDIRSEPWFVNAIARNPSLIEYTSGIRTLDKIYLDTSFTSDVPFQTKAEGVAELLRKISKYPADTLFHFQAWTYGYEDVWIALSKALRSQIHVDDYKMKIYKSLQVSLSDDRFPTSVHLSPEAPALVGYLRGNAPHPGCLTRDTDVRLHSCEKGNMCAIASDPKVVRIHPIIAHLPGGTDLAEVGVGGGGDDLEREAEINLLSQDDLKFLLESTAKLATLSTKAQDEITKFLTQLASHGRNLSLDLDIASFGNDESPENLTKVLQAIANKSTGTPPSEPPPRADDNTLPQVITFPYSRHSSYRELCHFVEIFKPKDVWPCTVDVQEWLRDGVSISSLFGRYCTGSKFEHDIMMESLAVEMDHESQPRQSSSQATDAQQPIESSSVIPPQDQAAATPPPHDTAVTRAGHDNSQSTRNQLAHQSQAASNNPLNPVDTHMQGTSRPDEASTTASATPSQPSPGNATKRTYEDYQDQQHNDEEEEEEEEDPGESQQTEKSFTSSLSMRHSTQRREAYYRMLEDGDGVGWSGFGLISTGGGHTQSEKEL